MCTYQDFLVGSGNFSPDLYPDLDPICTLVMESCMKKGKIFFLKRFYTFSGEFFHFSR